LEIKPIYNSLKNAGSTALMYTTDIDYIREAVEQADIVELDWWGYPYLNKIMWEIRDIPMRMIIWAMVSGCYFPYLKPSLVNLPHKFIFSSQYSYENQYWSEQERIQIRENFPTIDASGGFENTKDVPLEPHDGFNIGYLGTLKYIKLNPHFIDFCMGTIPEPNRILEEAKEKGIDHLFEFTGHVPKVSKELSRIDVLGYPLNPYTYVTSENSMLEAMSMGIPPVCLNQGAEKYLIRYNETGCLVNDKKEYKSAIKAMYEYGYYRKRLGYNAQEYVLQNLNSFNTTSKLNNVYHQVLDNRKNTFDVASAIGSTPYDWYQSTIPPCGIAEVLPHLYDDSKSSIKQWQKHFPKDKRLMKEGV
jgi:glycosyltransferase involved in cell wall biosynthesis